jgi:hypothetical protein
MDINALALQITNFVTLAVGNAGALLWNFLVLVVLTVVIVLFSYKTGRGGLVSLVLALYAGYAIYLVFPYDHTVISYGTTTLSRAVISIMLYIAACIVPFIFAQRLTHGGIGIISAVPRFGVSFLAAAFVIAIAYHVFNVNHLYSFPKPLDQLFAPDQYFFWWFIAPMVGLFLLVH